MSDPIQAREWRRIQTTSATQLLRTVLPWWKFRIEFYEFELDAAVRIVNRFNRQSWQFRRKGSDNFDHLADWVYEEFAKEKKQCTTTSP